MRNVQLSMYVCGDTRVRNPAGMSAMSVPLQILLSVNTRPMLKISLQTGMAQRWSLGQQQIVETETTASCFTSEQKFSDGVN